MSVWLCGTVLVIAFPAQYDGGTGDGTDLILIVVFVLFGEHSDDYFSIYSKLPVTPVEPSKITFGPDHLKK